MSGAAARLLADLLNSRDTPAKAANPAKTRARIESAADSDACEGLRKFANPQAVPGTFAADSQEFAALRSPGNRAESEHSCGSSQFSQDSQGVAVGNASASADADARFAARVNLFLRRGINAADADADALAEACYLRDVEGGTWAWCMECAHLSGRPHAWRCGNHRAAGVGRELPDAIALQSQRCPGLAFVSVH